MLRPIIWISRLIASRCPFLLMLPLSHENYTPYHHGKSVKKISRTVISCQFIRNIVKESDYTYYRRYYDPLLKERNKSEVCLRISPHILSNVSYNYSSELRIFMNRNELFKSSMMHNIAKRKYLRVLMSTRMPFLLNTISQQIIILRSQLLLRSKKRIIWLIISLLIG